MFVYLQGKTGASPIKNKGYEKSRRISVFS